MTDPLVVEVIGAPAPQGSKRHVGRGILVESSEAVGPWREAVANATRRTMDAGGRDALEGALELADAGAFANDAQVTDIARVSKRYADGRACGATLRLEVVDE